MPGFCRLHWAKRPAKPLLLAEVVLAADVAVEVLKLLPLLKLSKLRPRCLRQTQSLISSKMTKKTATSMISLRSSGGQWPFGLRTYGPSAIGTVCRSSPSQLGLYR